MRDCRSVSRYAPTILCAESALQIGGSGMMSGEQMIIGGGGSGAPSGPPEIRRLDAQSDMVSGKMSDPVHGTVEHVDGARLTIKAENGRSIAVHLAATAQLSKHTEGALAEIRIGAMVLASGERKGEIYEAMQVEIMPPPSR